MGQEHEHEHGPHTHSHASEGEAELPAWADPSVPETDLDPGGISRRNLLRNAGLLGGGAAAMSVLGGTGVAAASTRSQRGDEPHDDTRSYVYLAGDHHIHTQFSSDAMYRPHDQAFQAAKYGLDWIVITDHGSIGHAKFGVDKVNPDIRAARAALKSLLVFQGLEWNIPAAEHATIIVTPGDNEVSVLKAFENGYDGVVKSATGGAEGDPATAANELLAIQGLQFLKSKIGSSDGVDDAVMLANHPARKGLDTPHEFRAWRDQGQGVAIGMEGAPGHQNAAVPDGFHTAGARGEYGNTAVSVGPSAWAGYTTPNWEYYRTWGGFDAFTAMVGGLWDSLLSEGRPWWITANSDSHKVLGDPFVNGPIAPLADGTPAATFDDSGAYLAPVEVANISAADGLSYADFFPGAFSRNHVGASRFGYRSVLAGLRSGNAWVDHGQLVDDVQVRVKAGGWDMRGVTLGGTLQVRKGADVVITIDVTPAQQLNNNGDQPHLARVDVIRGLITGVVGDQDTLAAPQTKVVKMFDVSGRSNRVRLSLTFTGVSESFYLRLRGTDGNRLGAGFHPTQDPSGPKIDVIGSADPWKDLWFYTNPVFVHVG
jgi:PHP domain